MKRAIILVLVFMCAIGLTACGGKVMWARITECSSEIYTDEEIRQAINEAVRYFKREFAGCTLLEIGYAGDDKQAGFRDLAERRGADEVIVLISAFTVDNSGRSQSLNPNSTYKGWNWILVRDKGGPWKHMDHGYG